MQLPDGTDWIEYLLNVPENADRHTLDVINHIALGVPYQSGCKRTGEGGRQIGGGPEDGKGN